MKLWWTPCPRGLRQSWKIMVVTQNIDTLGLIWTFSLRGVLTFVASGLDINGCVFSYFEGTALLHYYTSCTFYIVAKCHFFSVVTWKDIKYLQTYEGCTHFCAILYIWVCVCVYIYIYIYIYIYTYTHVNINPKSYLQWFCLFIIVIDNNLKTVDWFSHPKSPGFNVNFF